MSFRVEYPESGLLSGDFDDVLVRCPSCARETGAYLHVIDGTVAYLSLRDVSVFGTEWRRAWERCAVTWTYATVDFEDGGYGPSLEDWDDCHVEDVLDSEPADETDEGHYESLQCRECYHDLWLEGCALDVLLRVELEDGREVWWHTVDGAVSDAEGTPGEPEADAVAEEPDKLVALLAELVPHQGGG